MSEFGRELARLMAAREMGVRELARAVPCNPGHVSNLRASRDRASAKMAVRLDEILGAGGSLLALVPSQDTGLVPAGTVTDELAALELARLAEASDVSEGTCERLELAVDDLAVAYPGTPPAELLS